MEVIVLAAAYFDKSWNEQWSDIHKKRVFGEILSRKLQKNKKNKIF